MPDISLVDLSKYRLSKACDMLVSAQRDLAAGDNASANNRAYYCIFHAIRAVLSLDGLDFKKHSTVIATFSQRYLKTEVFERGFGVLINSASLIRNRSDYEDFYVCSVEDTKRLIEGAAQFLDAVKAFLSMTYDRN